MGGIGIRCVELCFSSMIQDLYLPPGGLVAYHVWALFELEQELVESEIGKSLLVAFMMAQQVDNSKYHKLDRSNLEDTLVYLQALFDAFSPPFTDMQGEERLPLLVRSVHPTPDKKEELLKITVAAAEEIHSRMTFDTTEKLDEAVPLVVQILLRTYADIIDVLGLEASDLIQDAEAYESIT